jgi:hypothetical protein
MPARALIWVEPPTGARLAIIGSDFLGGAYVNRLSNC